MIQNVKNINNEATRDQAKICDMPNKVNDNINYLYKQIIDKENYFDVKLDKLNKLNDNFKKINNYIKENNEKTNIKDLKDTDNGYDNLIKEYNILKDIIHEYKDKIKRIKRKSNKTKDDFNKIRDLEKKLALQKDAINDSEYFLRIKENIIKNKKQTLSKLNKINTDAAKKIKQYDDMPYLETEEEAAENIADIKEQRDVRKKDDKALSDSPEKNKTNKTKKIVSDSNKDDDNKNIKIFYDDDDDDNIKISNDDGNIKISYHDDDYKINGLDKNGLDENGYNVNGLDENGYNINGIKGTKIKYPDKKLKYRKGVNNILYDQYGFDKDGFNKDGYAMYGFNKNGLNKNAFNIYSVLQSV